MDKADGVKYAATVEAFQTLPQGGRLPCPFCVYAGRETFTENGWNQHLQRKHPHHNFRNLSSGSKRQQSDPPPVPETVGPRRKIPRTDAGDCQFDGPPPPLNQCQRRSARVAAEAQQSGGSSSDEEWEAHEFPDYHELEDLMDPPPVFGSWTVGSEDDEKSCDDDGIALAGEDLSLQPLQDGQIEGLGAVSVPWALPGSPETFFALSCEERCKQHHARLHELHKKLKDENMLDPWEPLGTTITQQTNTGVFCLPKKGKLMISMLRLIHYSDIAPNNSRCYLDGQIAIEKEEMELRGYDPRDAPKRETVLNWAMEQFGKQTPKPTVYPVRRVMTLDPCNHANPERPIGTRKRDLLHAIVFNIEAQCNTLLDNDHLFGDLNNLVVNKDDPFLPYKNETGLLDEAMDGCWYEETVARLSKGGMFDKQNEFLVPVIMYLDKTGTTGNQRYPLEPVVFTFAILRRFLRNRPENWRLAGFLPDLDGNSSAQKRKHRQKNRGASSATYHNCLYHILRAFKHLETTGIHRYFRLGDKLKMMRLRFYIAFVINDGKSADMLTSRIAAHKGAKRISRLCDCPQHECSNVSRVCKPLLIKDYFKHFKTLEKNEASLREEIEQDHHKEQLKLRATNPNHVVEELEKEDLAQLLKERLLSTKKAMVAAGMQPALNAFVAASITFGYSPYGIFGSNPTDLMHAFQSGICPRVSRISLDRLSVGEKTELDDLVDDVFASHRSSQKDQYPRYSFSNGFSSLTQITSGEWVGVIFTLLIVLRTERGRKIFEPHFAEDNMTLPPLVVELEAQQGGLSVDDLNKYAAALFDMRNTELETPQEAPDLVDSETGELSDELLGGDDDPLDPESAEEVAVNCSIDDMIQLLEGLLSFHAWYKYGSIRVGDLERVTASIRKLIAMVIFYAPRKNANGWNLQKVHDILHLPFFIKLFARPSNFDAEVGESGLRTWAKWPAATAAKRGDRNTFTKQCGLRMWEQLTLETARRELGVYHHSNSAPPETDDGEPRLAGSRFTVKLSGLTECVSGSNRRRKNMTEVHPLVVEHLRRAHSGENVCQENGWQCVPPDKKDGSWTVHTECSFVSTTTKERINCRCHSNFRGEGPWYDWVSVMFELEEGRDDRGGAFLGDKKFIPSKVLAFLEHPETKKVYAIVHPCEWRSQDDKEADSVLTERWRLHYMKERGQVEGYTPVLCVVELSSIGDGCLVIEEAPGVKELVRAKDFGHNDEFRNVMVVLNRKEWASQFT